MHVTASSRFFEFRPVTLLTLPWLVHNQDRIEYSSFFSGPCFNFLYF